ncbi:MAG TPA: hypothetical protein VFI11_00220 [Anaerolineales bacterium]|nr:hypothetical protein [Anaerolineales bacterium]
MQMFLGTLMVIVGLALIVVSVLVWVGVISPKGRMGMAETTWPDVAKEVLNKVPWVALVGLALIYLGLRAVGVDLSF